MSDSPIPREVVEEALKIASRGGADYADVFVERVTADAVTAETTDNQRNVQSKIDAGVGIRVVRDGVTTNVTVEGLDHRAILDAARTAAAQAKSQTANNSVNLTTTEPIVHAAQRPLEAISIQQRVDLAGSALETAQARHSSIRQVSVGIGTKIREVMVATSLGRYAEGTQQRARGAVQVVAANSEITQTGMGTAGALGGFEVIDDPNLIQAAISAADDANLLLGARPAPAGPMPVVIGPRFGGVIFHEAAGHPMELDHMNDGGSIFANKLGQQIAAPILSAVDDGTMVGEWGSMPFDDEGNPAARNVLIEDGVMVGTMSDTRQSMRNGTEPSGNARRESFRHATIPRMTNTFICAGKENVSAAEILADTPHGLYAESFSGGQVNPTNGDFTFSPTVAWVIKDGKLAYPVRGATLIGRCSEVLMKVDAIASDDWGLGSGMCGKSGQSIPVTVGQPTIRVSEITVGGTERGLA